MNSITSKISIIVLSLMASTFTFAEDKPAEEWLFVHTADEAQVTNNTTIVMPVTRDIFAFTDRPYRKHAYMTGQQFASLWADSGSDSFKTDPPNAVLTWVEGEDVKEAEVVITGASIDGNSITYTTNSHPNTVGTIKSVSVFVDDAASPCYWQPMTSEWIAKKNHTQNECQAQSAAAFLCATQNQCD
tara:strand:+ start:95 stop:655 length:561 start_codon:yes stop_codon:yes gene_type:complete